MTHQTLDQGKVSKHWTQYLGPAAHVLLQLQQTTLLVHCKCSIPCQKLVGCAGMHPVKSWRSMPSRICQHEWPSALCAARWAD